MSVPLPLSPYLILADPIPAQSSLSMRPVTVACALLRQPGGFEGLFVTENRATLAKGHVVGPARPVCTPHLYVELCRLVRPNGCAEPPERGVGRESAVVAVPRQHVPLGVIERRVGGEGRSGLHGHKDESGCSEGEEVRVGRTYHAVDSWARELRRLIDRIVGFEAVVLAIGIR